MTPLDQVRKEELNRRLRVLSEWALTRASGEYNTDTTLTMLKKKVADIEGGMNRAGWRSLTPPLHTRSGIPLSEYVSDCCGVEIFRRDGAEACSRCQNYCMPALMKVNP